MTTEDAPAPLPASIPAALATALEAQGYTTLTPVQEAMLAPAHETADLLVSAQTGSGKTVAFGLAIAQTLLGDGGVFEAPGAPLGLVIAPTRELAMQVRRELDWLYAAAGMRTATGVGGMDLRAERRALERGAHLVVGTPGRLRDHISKGVLDLSGIRAIVLDEADEMLDLGFRDDLEFILAAAPEERRTLMFSATVAKGIAELAATYQRDAVRVAVSAPDAQHADIEYQMMLVARDEREHAIINTLLGSDSDSALVFCHTREAVKHLAARLANRGFSAVALSGELAQSERSSALQAMRDGRAQVCVATDVAARGIDLPNLGLVIHADIPGNPATLLHRSGRTGRAGRKGVCVLIVPEHRRAAATRVLSLAKLTATLRTPPTIADIEERYQTDIVAAARTEAPPEEAEAVLVAKLLSEVGPEQLAAAFVRQELKRRPVPEEVTVLPLTLTREKRTRKDRAERTERPERGERLAPGQSFDWSDALEGGGQDRSHQRGRPERGGDFADGAWFTLSLGRKHRADPKWLLPMICKAGGVTKREVGAIRIDETETRFEIAADAAPDFAEQVSRKGALEKGVRIRPQQEGAPEAAAPARKPREPRAADEEAGRPWASDAPTERAADERPFGKKPYGKAQFEKGASDKPPYEKKAYAKKPFDKKPSDNPGPARSDWAKPAGSKPYAKVASAKPKKADKTRPDKDKGKPKPRSKPDGAGAGDAPRARKRPE
ncbi:MAG: DEAD/DEAH box helicase [Devosia sp.]